MIPKKFEPILFGFLLSCLMSLIVSGVSTLHVLGFQHGFIKIWFGAWITAWMIAFPAVLFTAPLVRRIVHNLVKH